MKPFSLSEQQIASIISAACADELSRRFNRHIDFLTAASWTGRTPLGAGGLGLSAPERTGCAQRAASLFGLPEDFLFEIQAEQIADWAKVLAAAVEESLTAFSFKPAARSSDDVAYRHNADEIYQDAAAAANILYGRRRLLSFVAPHSLLGLELSVLTPNLLGVEAVDARRMTPDSLTRSLVFGDVLVATPTLWRYMMQEELTAPDNMLAVSFGEPMTPDLASAMRKRGFGVLRELYGSTETGLIGWRDAPGEPFTLFDHWQRNDDQLMRLTPSGETRPVEPMDSLNWTGARRFMLAGRRDGAVQIGAVNVFPDEVAAALRGHPHVRDCRISVSQRGDSIARLVAHIILEDGVKPNEQSAREIDAWCRSALRQQERPRIFQFEAEIG